MSKIKKQAEGYALKVKSTNGYYLYQDIIKAVLKGVELASQWNSPDEKPKQHIKLLEPIIIKRDSWRYIGYFNNVINKWFVIFNIDLKAKVDIQTPFTDSEIDGWQYLPEIKK